MNDFDALAPQVRRLELINAIGWIDSHYVGAHSLASLRFLRLAGPSGVQMYAFLRRLACPLDTLEIALDSIQRCPDLSECVLSILSYLLTEIAQGAGLLAVRKLKTLRLPRFDEVKKAWSGRDKLETIFADISDAAGKIGVEVEWVEYVDGQRVV